MCKCGSMQIVQVKPSWADKLFGYSAIQKDGNANFVVRSTASKN